MTPFDKVLGGLAWAIAGSAVDVDVDVFFEDDATLGEKNKCAEDVCRALLRMKCPSPLRSFQLTRSDWKSVHPVVVWVIRTVLETRHERQRALRQAAECRYGRRERGNVAVLNVDVARERGREASGQVLRTLEKELGPKRRFRQGGSALDAGSKREGERVMNVLREYGTTGGQGGQGQGGANQAQGLQEGYAAWSGREQVAGSIVGGLMGVDEVRQLRALYEEGRAGRPLTEAQLAERMHRSKVEALTGKLDEGRKMLDALQAERDAGERRLREMREALEARRKQLKATEEEIERFKQLMQQSEYADTIRELQGLVSLNEQLKGHMEKFEASCRRQAEELRQRALALRGGEEGDDEEARFVARVERAHAEGKAKMQQLKAIAGRKHRAVLLLERKLDEVPTQAEMAQYGRMLVELYEQINSKFVETRQYYNTFNALDDTRRFLERELSIVKSINEQYGEAMKNRSNKEAFVNSMQTIVASVEQTLDKTKGKHQEEAERRDLLRQQHVALLDKQRDYAKLTKEFSSEASKNAEYEAKLASASTTQ